MSALPDPEFKEFACDCIRLAGQERSRELRSRLVVLAREWMHAAMQKRPDGAIRMVPTSDEPWSREDLEDLKYWLEDGTTHADAANLLCRSADEVRLKAHELGLVDDPRGPGLAKRQASGN
jgi:hypothetical protein